MDNHELLNRILRSSKTYKFEGDVLTLTHYYTGESVKLDLSLLSPETVEAIIVTNEDSDEY